MNCKKCGSPIASDSKFCTKCGEQVSESINPSVYGQQNVLSNQDVVYKAKKETLGTVSLILGIVSLVLAFFLNIFILPLALTGLILGIVNKCNHGKKVSGIVLNSISMVVAVAVLIVGAYILGIFGYLGSNSNNYVAGKYNCTGVDSNTDKYLVTIHLNKDNTFLYGPYGNLENNYAKGVYSYEDEHKTDHSGQYKYFMVTMNGNQEDFIINGVPADHDFSSKMEFGITTEDGKKQGVILFLSTYNMYYCYEI